MKKILLLLALALATWLLLEQRAVYHRGPPSDHFDGVRFFNPGRPIGKGLVDVIQWKLKGGAATWPEAMPLAAPARPAPRVEGAALAVTFVGHATVLVQTAGLNVLTDPIWSERAGPFGLLGPPRVTPPGVPFGDLPRIDLVLVSHSHFDHMDLPTLARLRERDDPLFVVPLGNDAILRSADAAMRVHALDWWQSVEVQPGVRVHATPVYHWSRRRALDRNKALWSGFLLETPGGKVYAAGDTGFGDGSFFRQTADRLGPIRLALLPVGAYEPRWFMKDQHVNPDEAVRIHALLGAQHSLGVHLRTFQLTDEQIDTPEAELAAALRAHEVNPERFFTLPIGGAWSSAAPAAP